MTTRAAIVATAKELPQDELVDLIDDLIMVAHDPADPGVAAAWKDEIRRRVAEADAGRGEWLDGEPILKALREGRRP